MNTTDLLLNSSIETVENTMEGLYLTFILEDLTYGVEVEYVREIVDLHKITVVPGVTDYIKGLINLRGQVIPVIDVRLRFGLEFKDYHSRTCIIIVEVEHTKVGLIVDQVSDVLVIPDQNIQPPPVSEQSDQQKFLKAFGKINGEVKLLIDIGKVIAGVPEMPSL